MTYLVSDIHGRADRFHNILARIRFSKADTLYVLGDVIDRNPDGIRILTEIMEAENMYMILGNHEYMMLNVVRASADEMDRQWADNVGLWYLNGGEITLRAFCELPAAERVRIIRYLEELPLNRELTVNGREYLLVHGSPASAYTPDNGDYSDATAYAVWNRLDPFAKNPFGGKTIVYGHTPTIYLTNKIPMEVFVCGNTVNIDCGCAYPDGRLSCLCLETGGIFYSTDA